VFLGSSKGLSIGKGLKMRSKRRKELATIAPPTAILQENITRRNNIGKKKFKGFSQVATIRKIELLVTSLSNLKICRDARFINSRASQHLIIFLMYVGKMLLFSTCQIGFSNVLEMCCIS
jgi:hypothetical protein